VIKPWGDVGLEDPRFQPVIEQDVETKQFMAAVAASDVRFHGSTYVSLGTAPQ